MPSAALIVIWWFNEVRLALCARTFFAGLVSQIECFFKDGKRFGFQVYLLLSGLTRASLAAFGRVDVDALVITLSPILLRLMQKVAAIAESAVSIVSVRSPARLQI